MELNICANYFHTEKMKVVNDYYIELNDCIVSGDIVVTSGTKYLQPNGRITIGYNPIDLGFNRSGNTINPQYPNTTGDTGENIEGAELALYQINKLMLRILLKCICIYTL